MAKGIDANKVTILARASDTTDWKTTEDVEVAGDVVTITVPAARTALVHVVDETSKPIAGARLAVIKDMRGDNERERFTPALVPQINAPLKLKFEAAEGARTACGASAPAHTNYTRRPRATESRSSDSPSSRPRAKPMSAFRSSSRTRSASRCMARKTASASRSRR